MRDGRKVPASWWGVTVWTLVGLTVAGQICYPLVSGTARDGLTIATVCLGAAAALWHAFATRDGRTVLALFAVSAGGGLAVEAVGTATGFPFGGYEYARSLGPAVLAVPLAIPLAWTMMAWPAWLASGRLVGSAGAARVVVAGWALASWDVFLDPQMVAAGRWSWSTPSPSLPGVPLIPLTNYVGWLVTAVAMMAVLSFALPRTAAMPPAAADVPMLAFYLWTYASSVLAHLAFFGLAGAALWGGLVMGVVAVPLAVTLWRRRPELLSPPTGTAMSPGLIRRSIR